MAIGLQEGMALRCPLFYCLSKRICLVYMGMKEPQSDGLVNFENYKPLKAQYDAHVCPSMYKFYGGAMATGKTFWLCYEAIKLCLLYPGNVFMLCRYRYKDLKSTTLPVLLDMIPPKLLLNYNKSDGLIELKAGKGKKSTILLRGLDDPNKLKSANLGGGGIDEATDVPDESAFNMLRTRLRLKLPGIRRFLLLTGNPEPGWVKDRFITNPAPNYRYFFCSPYENHYLDESYIKELEDLPPIWRAKYLEGSWEAFEGQIIEPHWLPYFDGTIDSTNPWRVKIMAVDPAFTEKELIADDPDETSITTIGNKFNDHRILELSTLHGCWSLDKRIQIIKDEFKRQQPDHLVVEAVAGAKDFAEILRREGLPARDWTPGRSNKVTRLVSVQHYFERGAVYIKTQKLRDQLLEFPTGTHDDLVDSLTIALKQFQLVTGDDYESQIIAPQKNKQTEVYRDLQAELKGDEMGDMMRHFESMF